MLSDDISAMSRRWSPDAPLGTWVGRVRMEVVESMLGCCLSWEMGKNDLEHGGHVLQLMALSLLRPCLESYPHLVYSYHWSVALAVTPGSS